MTANQLEAEEATFAKLFRAGAVRSVHLTFELDGRRCLVRYVNGSDVAGHIVTKRGDVKLYRLETCFAFLRRVGVGVVSVDLSRFDGVAAQGKLL